MFQHSLHDQDSVARICVSIPKFYKVRLNLFECWRSFPLQKYDDRYARESLLWHIAKWWSVLYLDV